MKDALTRGERRERWTWAYRVPCETCFARVGKPCGPAGRRSLGSPVEPHRQRVLFAGRELARKLDLAEARGFGGEAHDAMLKAAS